MSIRSSGFSLIEAMVALMILSVVSGAVVLMTLQILSLTYSSRLKNQSTTYAEEMIEKVRDAYQSYGYAAVSTRSSPSGTCYSSVDGNPMSWSSVACPATDCSGAQISATNFYRYVNLKLVSSSVNVSSVVTWFDKVSCKREQVDTYFYNY